MTPEKAANLLKEEMPNWIKKDVQGQIAFFGGTFTGLPMEEMAAYLKAAKPYVQSGAVDGIRISTRPDCIDDEILTFLAQYGVTHIELGVQSLADDVLHAAGRGYISQTVVKSAEKIQKAGFALGMQMMPGLPLDTDEKSLMTAQKIVLLGATETRIYPTVVIRDTPLSKLYAKDEYHPFELEHAVNLTANLKQFFENHSVKVLKVGLHSGQVEKDIIAGPFHPAFGQLVNSKICLDKLIAFCKENKLRDTTLLVCPKNYDISDIVGQHRQNLKCLMNDFAVSLKISKKELTNQKNSIIL